MKNKLCSAIVFILVITTQSFAQSIDDLQREIERIAASKKALVGVSIVGSDGRDKISVNGGKRFPMQSVFKLHIGLAMLSEIDKGKFSLEQKVEISKKDLQLDLYSPIKDKFPNGTTLTIAELLEYTVSASDNVGCEVLLRMLGEPSAVENYFVRNKFKDVKIKFNEEQQQGNWELQFQNWTTPNAANKVLQAFFTNERKLLSPKSYEFLWKIMRETETGQNRLKGQLPEGTIVAHKTGSSGVNRTTGITAAVNDIGIVFLPNGKHFYISVFITDSKEDAAANEKTIADISKTAWDYFSEKTE